MGGRESQNLEILPLPSCAHSLWTSEQLASLGFSLLPEEEGGWARISGNTPLSVSGYGHSEAMGSHHGGGEWNQHVVGSCPQLAPSQRSGPSLPNSSPCLSSSSLRLQLPYTAA